jgi:hypothetical protein
MLGWDRDDEIAASITALNTQTDNSGHRKSAVHTTFQRCCGEIKTIR